MSDTELFFYVGRNRCGCVVAAHVDLPAHVRTPGYLDELKKFIGAMILDGLTVERVKGPVRVASCVCQNSATGG
jgi:kynurenine formamidase